MVSSITLQLHKKFISIYFFVYNACEGVSKYYIKIYHLLNLTQSIVDGFNEEKFTLAVLIDFEKAYDSVWREGLLLKLFLVFLEILHLPFSIVWVSILHSNF
jgi:hypothetical protein